MAMGQNFECLNQLISPLMSQFEGWGCDRVVSEFLVAIPELYGIEMHSYRHKFKFIDEMILCEFCGFNH